jgi:hypothetical protein
VKTADIEMSIQLFQFAFSIGFVGGWFVVFVVFTTQRLRLLSSHPAPSVP